MWKKLLNSSKNAYIRFETLKSRVRAWFLAFSRKPHASAWLSFFSFAESSFFPIPPDILQIALTLAHGARWAWYALVTTASSVAGGLAGYFIGAVFFWSLGEPLIAFYGLESEMAQVGEAFLKFTFWAIFAAAFTPIPYKVFTIAGGFFGVNIWIFLAASILGRGMRFFVIGFLTERYGAKLRYLIYRSFNIASLALIAILALWLIFA